MQSESSAVLDAAIIYGASRYLRQVHDDETWQYRDSFNKAYDRDLFFEFLHDILLYEYILLDNSSVSSSISNEISDLIRNINLRQNQELVTTKDIANFGQHQLGWIMSGVCRMVKDIPDKNQILDVSVPWAYKSRDHHDFKELSYYANERGLNSELIPFTLFAFRGLCYSSFANHRAKYDEKPTVYIAAPGRLSALKHITSGHILERHSYVKHAYVELLKYLDLPIEGYSFDDIGDSLMGHETSRLTRHLFDLPPMVAFNEVLALRESNIATKIRREWQEKIWEHSISCSVGLSAAQFVKDSNVHGDLTLNINTYTHAFPFHESRRI